MISDDQVFDSMVTSEPEVDYTGLNAAYYIDKYTNRPEDQGDLQAIQSMLSNVGIVAPPADMINAAIYAVQGEWGMAGLSAAAVIPILGDMHKAKKSGEKMITLYRGVKNIDDVNAMSKNGKIVGNWKNSAWGKSEKRIVKMPGGEERYVFDGVIGSEGTPLMTTLPLDVPIDNLLFTTNNFSEVVKYAQGSQGGMILKFEVPLSYINQHGRNVFGSKWTKWGGEFGDKASKQTLEKGFPSIIFEDGLPVEFLSTVEKTAEIPVSKLHQKLFEEAKKRGNQAEPEMFTKLSPLQEKLNKLKDNPNIGGHFNKMQKENIKRYSR